jgi:hypothetical protein
MTGTGSTRSSCRSLCWLLLLRLLRLLRLLLVNVSRVLLRTSVSEVEALGSHLRPNSAILNLKN